MLYDSEQINELKDDKVLSPKSAVMSMLAEHNVDFSEFIDDFGTHDYYDLADVMHWVGY